jgi:hypothetical protein
VAGEADGAGRAGVGGAGRAGAGGAGGGYEFGGANSAGGADALALANAPALARAGETTVSQLRLNSTVQCLLRAPGGSGIRASSSPCLVWAQTRPERPPGSTSGNRAVHADPLASVISGSDVGMRCPVGVDLWKGRHTLSLIHADGVSARE